MRSRMALVSSCKRHVARGVGESFATGRLGLFCQVGVPASAQGGVMAGVWGGYGESHRHFR